MVAGSGNKVVRRSFNEIGTQFRKASIGAGFPVGLAEEIERAGICLIRNGFDGAGAVLEAISPGYRPCPPADWEKDTLKFTDFSAAACGPSLFDMAVAAGKTFTAKLNRVDCPLMLVGFALSAAHNYGLDIRIQNEQKEIVRISLPRISCALERLLKVSSCIVKSRQDLRLLPGEDTVTEAEIAEDLWQALDKFSHKTYVPATAASRLRGAGAVQIDND